MVGRGLLGRWGPNHAADPIVTRYRNCLYMFVCVLCVCVRACVCVMFGRKYLFLR